MPRFFPLFFLLFALLPGAGWAAAPLLEFIPNHGQWPAAVRLRADVGPGLSVFLEDQRLTFLRYDADGWSQWAHQRGNRQAGVALPEKPVQAHSWVVEFVGSRPGAQPRPDGKLLGPVRNYFVGRSPRAWATNVRATAAAHYADLWPGIGLRVHSSAEGAFEYDLEVRPGADPAQAVLRYRGLQAVSLDATTGRLRLVTALGELTEAAPIAWQTDAAGNRRPVPCRFVLSSEAAAPPHRTAAQVSFELPAGYDRTRPLVIDPVLVAATYSGSTSPVFGHTATYDASGHLYAAGPCFDAGYPTTVGAFDLTHTGNNQPGAYGNPDVAISRYSPDGSRLLYATYLGGSQPDYPHSLLVNHQGELLVLGSTFSPDFPTTAGAYDRQFGGRIDSSDIFLTKLDSTGARLLGSTYLGGSGDDGRSPDALRFFFGDTYRGDLAVDSLDRVVIASTTRSRNFPFTAGAVRPTPGFTCAAVVARFSADLTRLDWAAGLGEYATAYGIYLPPSGEPFVVGTTYSTGFPTTPGTLDPAEVGRGGQRQRDGYVARLAADGSAVRAATYLRAGVGAFATQAFFIQPDPQSSDVYVLGSSSGFYTPTPGAWGQPGGSIVVQRLSADLRQRGLVATLGNHVSYGYQSLGGGYIQPSTDNLSPTAFLVDQCGAIYFSAWGRTRGLPTTGNALQPGTDGQDLYLMVLNPDATSLSYASYLGGNSITSQSEEHVDGGTSRFDPRGRVYQAVCTNAHNFPTTPTAWRTSNRVGSSGPWSNAYDEVALKLDFEPRQVRAAAVAANAGGGSTLEAPVTIQFTNQSTNFPGTTYQWTFGDGSPASLDFAPSHLYLDPGTYTVILIATDSGACGSADTVQLVLTILPNDSTDYLSYSICRGDSVRFDRIGAQPGSFTWSPATTLSSPTVPDPIASPLVSTQYEATGRLPNSARRNTWKVAVTVVQPDSVTLTAERHCLPGGIEAVLQLSQPLQQIVWDYGDGSPRDSLAQGQLITHFFRHPGQYTVRVSGRDSHACRVQLELPIQTDALFVPNIFTPNADGFNDTFVVGCLEPGTATLQVYNRWGRLVYESGENQYANQWDGRQLPDGLYYYYLRFSYAPTGFKGWVQITR